MNLAPSGHQKIAKVEINSTVHRIFEGTLTALSNRGGTLLSMTDIVAASGVSRATLYRYFPSKEVLLQSFGEYTVSRFAEGVAKAAEGQESPQSIIRAVLSYTTQFTIDMKSDRIIAVEAQWMTAALTEQFGFNLSALNGALAPVYDALEAKMGIELNREFIGETIIRLQESTSILAGDDYLDQLVDFAPKIVDFVLTLGRA